MAIQVDADKRLSGVQVKKIIEDFDTTQYTINEKYYQGENIHVNVIGNEKRTQGIKPNNVIPLPFARRTINDLTGYAYKPGNVTYNFEEEQKEADTIKEILENNEEPLVSSEIFQDAAINGEGAEVIWYTEENGIEFAQVDRNQCIFEYTDDIKQNKLKWSIRYYRTREIQDDGTDLIIHHANVYFNDRVDFYEGKEDKDKIAIDPQRKQQRFDNVQHEDEGIEYKYIESEKHAFGDVPLYPYQINNDNLGVFQPSIPIIDELDKLGSNSMADEIDRFNAIILLLSKKVDAETSKKIMGMTIFDALGTKDEGQFVEFLKKELDIQSTIETTKIFERWYYELTGIPNLNDEKFNAKSGVALAFALVSFENLVTTMEAYFSKGLKYRLKLINNALKSLNRGYQEVTATLQWKRNLPSDLLSRAELVRTLKEANLLSDATLIKMFGSDLIKDIDAEIKARREQDRLDAESFQIPPVEDDNADRE